MGIENGRQSRKGPRWPPRRLIAAVVCTAVLGAVALVYALAHAIDGAPTENSSVSTVKRNTVTAPSSPGSTRPGASGVPPTRVRRPGVSGAPSSRAGAATNSATSATTAALGPDARASFLNLVARLGGDAHISLAIQPLGRGPMQVLGGDPVMRAMSTSKILILSALLRDKGGVSHLTTEQMSLARAAVTQSDNDAILELFSSLEADHGGLLGATAYATSLLREVGDRQTQVTTAAPPAGYATTFGQTPWTPTAEVRFFRALALGCILPEPDTDYELGLMRDIEPSESFGLGSAGFRQVAFKGGWGPEPGGEYGVRQTGVIGGGDSGVVVSLVADPVSTFEVGQSVLDEVARWLRDQVRLAPRPRGSCPA